MAQSVKDFIASRLAAQADNSVDDDDEESAATGAEDDDTPYDKVSRASMPAPDLGRGPLAAESEDAPGDIQGLLQARSQLQGQSNVYTALGGLANAGNSANNGQATAQAVQKGIEDQGAVAVKGQEFALQQSAAVKKAIQQAQAKRDAAKTLADSRLAVANINKSASDVSAGQSARDRSDAADQKKTDKQTQSYNQTVLQLEQMRGSPAASQAEKDIYAAQKADSLLKTAAPDGDLNKINPQMASLLRNEVGKIATGGTPSMHELSGLDPGTLSGSLASVWQKLSNDPSPANAGAFLKQYQDYAHSVAADAKGVIEDRYGRFINTRKSQFTDDQNQMLQDQYVNRFKDAAKGAPPAPPADTVLIRDPQGNIRKIPAAQKDAALAACGSLAQ